MAYFTAIEEVINYVKPLLDNAPSLANVEHVGLAEDGMIFDKYPAIVITAEPVVREIHATHQFKNFFRLAIFVYHAEATEDRDTRTIEDLELVTAIKNVLASDRSLGGGVIFGWIDQEIPGTIRRPGNIWAIGSRLSWRGEALEAF